MAGQHIAEYIVDGQACFDGNDFDPERFRGFDTNSDLAQAMSHDEMVEAYAMRTKGLVRQRY